MPLLRVHCFGLSVDGFGAGPRQSLSDPMGAGGMALHEWVFPTRTFKQMHAELGLAAGGGEGTIGADDEFAARGFEGIGAWIIGRNMFGPIRGPWLDGSWKGWWGDNPPYHTPVFVLTNHPREPLMMDGGTTFYFVTGGIKEAYDRAMEGAKGKDVRLGGGANTIRQYLAARLVDHMHLAAGPVLLGSGEHLLVGLDLPALGYEISHQANSRATAHIVIRRKV
ncbi:MAG: dihydrofolate reductase family protein [Planctomycetota bacterium]